MVAKKILFFANTKFLDAFCRQKYYLNTVEILKRNGCEIILSNKISDVFKYDYDCIFNFFYKKGVIASLISKIKGKKVYFTGGLDDLDYRYANLYRYFRQAVIFKICLWLADCVLVESHSDLVNINKICFGKHHKNIFYVPQAIDIKLYKSNFNLKENLFSTICWLGELSNPIRKGVDASLYYFKYLSSFPEFSDYKYYIMGRKDGAAVAYIENIIQDLGLTDKVILTGEVSEEDKIRILKKSKFFFQLSKTEGFGLAALEALAAGCIAIHTGKGGLQDVIANDGILVDNSTFKYTVESIDKSVYPKILSKGIDDVSNMEKRISRIFDVSVRYDNFNKTIFKNLYS